MLAILQNHECGNHGPVSNEITIAEAFSSAIDEHAYYFKTSPQFYDLVKAYIDLLEDQEPAA